MTLSQTSETTASPAHPKPLAWLAGAFVGTALLALLAAQLPDRAKLLGLFPLIWGGLVGWGLRWWADECQLTLKPWLFCTAFLLLAVGETGMVCQAWLGYQAELRQQFALNPGAAFVQQAQEAAADGKRPELVELSRQFQADVERGRERRRQELQLATFLRRRLKTLGDLPQPVPELFWTAEILLGSLCGLVVMKRK